MNVSHLLQLVIRSPLAVYVVHIISLELYLAYMAPSQWLQEDRLYDDNHYSMACQIDRKDMTNSCQSGARYNPCHQLCAVLVLMGPRISVKWHGVPQYAQTTCLVYWGTLLYTDIRPQKNQYPIHRDLRDSAVSEEILGIICRNPRVSKSNRLHALIYQFFFCSLRHIPQIPLKWSTIFMKSWNFNWLFLKLNRLIWN